jgi:hypothetical protein
MHRVYVSHLMSGTGAPGSSSVKGRWLRSRRPFALRPSWANSLYGRSIAKRKNGDPTGADADLAAAKAIRPGIAQEFVSEIE